MHKKFYRSRPLRAFSLIEMAIVMAIVSLVLAGIWSAASAVASKRRANVMAEGIFYIQTKADQKLSLTDYPQYNGGWWGMQPLFSGAGLIPPGFTFNGNEFVTPFGASINTFGVCWGSVGSTSCPMMGLMVGGLAQAECTQVLRRVLTNLRTSQDLRYIDVDGTTTPKVTYTTASTINTATCPADFSNMQLFFRP